MSSTAPEIIKAYVLISVSLGKTKEAIKNLKQITNITSVAVITGEYDVIVRIETSSINDLYNCVQEIHLIDGIIDTTTSIIQKEI